MAVAHAVAGVLCAIVLCRAEHAVEALMALGGRLLRTLAWLPFPGTQLVPSQWPSVRQDFADVLAPG